MSCRLCHNLNQKTIICGYKTSLLEYFDLKKCCECGFASLDPIPNDEDLSKYYSCEYWQKGKQSKSVDRFYQIRMNKLLKVIGKLKNGNKLLDVGAGDGKFVDFMKKNGFDSSGIDLHTKSDSILQMKLSSSQLGKFDIITYLHVLEHLRNPWKSLRDAYEKLNKNGLIVVELPNIESLTFKFFRKRWQPLELPTHINHFSLKSMRKSVNKIKGLKIEKVEHFSAKTSPSVFVLSLFPSLTPKKVRQKHKGKIPKMILFLYLSLQLMFYPLAKLESFLKKGSIIRFYIRKEDEN